MPQLNPAPWLAIMIFSWLTFLIILPPKVMAYIFPNEATLQSTEKSNTTAWNWPWL